MKPLRFLSRERLPEIGLIASILLLLGVGGALAEGLPVWHEIVSALPNNGYRVLAPEVGASLNGPLHEIEAKERVAALEFDRQRRRGAVERGVARGIQIGM